MFYQFERRNRYLYENILITKTYAKNFEFVFAALPAIDDDG